MSTVNEMIASVQDAEYQAMQERQTRIERYKAEAEALLQPALAEVWDELSEHVQKVDTSGNEKGITIVYEVNAPDALQIAPFYVVCHAGRVGPATHFRCTQNGVNSSASLEEILANRRQAYPAHVEAMMLLRTREYGRLLDPYHPGFAKGINEAKAALQNLIAIWPARTADWCTCYDTWKEVYERNQAYEAAQRLEAEQHKREREAFAASWEVYLRKSTEILANNRQKLDELQAGMDIPYQVQEYEYGISCHEETGKVETRTVWVSPERNNEYVTVIHRGRPEEKFFYDPVSHGKPLSLRPTDGHETAGKVFVQFAKDWLFYAPGVEAQKEIDALGLENFPARPVPPDWMQSYEIRDICGDYREFPA